MLLMLLAVAPAVGEAGLRCDDHYYYDGDFDDDDYLNVDDAFDDNESGTSSGLRCDDDDFNHDDNINYGDFCDDVF